MERTPLYSFHTDNGGKMVDFAGWEMPLTYKIDLPDGETYGGVHNEHHQVRTSGGFFDVSHMGRVWVTGRHARKFVERLVTRRVSDMKQGQCRYALVLNEEGGVKDDVLVYRMDDAEFMLVVNAANRLKLIEHFQVVKAGMGDDAVVKIDDRTMKTGMVAIQGPKVMDIISKFSKEIPTLKRYKFVEKNFFVMKVLVSRTGYTGEDGVEVIVPSNSVKMALGLLVKNLGNPAEAAAKPAGLAARDTLRMEAGMALYGNELREDIHVLEANIGFAMNIDKDEDERGEPYVGMEAVKRVRDNGGPDRLLVGMYIDGKRTARSHNAIQAEDGPDAGTVVGEVTSACLSPTLERPIAMGYVAKQYAQPGTKLRIDTGKTTLEAEVTPLPFYKAPKPEAAAATV